MDTMKHDEDEPAPNDHDWADRVCVLLHVGGDGTVQYSTVQYSTPRTPLEIRWRSVGDPFGTMVQSVSLTAGVPHV